MHTTQKALGYKWRGEVGKQPRVRCLKFEIPVHTDINFGITHKKYYVICASNIRVFTTFSSSVRWECLFLPYKIMYRLFSIYNRFSTEWPLCPYFVMYSNYVTLPCALTLSSINDVSSHVKFCFIFYLEHVIVIPHIVEKTHLTNRPASPYG